MKILKKIIRGILWGIVGIVALLCIAAILYQIASFFIVPWKGLGGFIGFLLGSLLVIVVEVGISGGIIALLAFFIDKLKN